jgi:hypothetical protein
MTRPLNTSDTGLWLRGMALFLVLGGISGVVLFLLLGRTAPVPPAAPPVAPERIATLMAVPLAPFPGTLSWGALYQLCEDLPSAPGWEIRYNATLALARHGSPNLPLDVMREMLDERKQLLNFGKIQKDGQTVTNEDAARRTVLNALKAFVEWHQHPDAAKKFGRDKTDLQQVYGAIDRLTQSPNPTLRAEAEQARKTLGKA